MPEYIAGVPWTKAFVEEMGGKATHLAGAMGLETAGDVWRLWKDEGPIRDVIQSWVDSKKQDFNDPDYNSSKHGIRPSIVSHAVDKQNTAVIMGSEPPRSGHAGVKTSVIAPMTLLWHLARLIRIEPSLFPRSNLAAVPPTLDRRDVVVGWKLFTFFHKAISVGHVPKKVPNTRAAVPALVGVEVAEVLVPAGVTDDAETAKSLPGLGVGELMTVWEAQEARRDTAAGVVQEVLRAIECRAVPTAAGERKPPLSASATTRTVRIRNAV